MCLQWHSLSREEQAKYYELARKERQLHSQLYPGWSARDNYVSQTFQHTCAHSLTLTFVCCQMAQFLSIRYSWVSLAVFVNSGETNPMIFFLCVCYALKIYTPPSRKNSYCIALTDLHLKSYVIILKICCILILVGIKGFLIKRKKHTVTGI